MSTPPRRRREPAAIGDVVAGFLRNSGLREKLRSPEVYDCWPEVAGAEICKHTRVVGFTNCVLHVEVDSAPWLQMLAAFRKPELLKGLEERLSGVRIRDIKFRIGTAPAADVLERNLWPNTTARPSTTRRASRSSPA